MKRGVAGILALALVASVVGPRAASAQMASQCNDFIKLRDDTGRKAMAVKDATAKHADRKEVCVLVTKFSAAEALMVKFLIDNKTWCGVPDIAVTNAKLGHANTMKFQKVVCTDAPPPGPRPPSLSDALGTPTLDTAKNTKTGAGGTFDTLTGNPLAK